jgi:hypothetical protein
VPRTRKNVRIQEASPVKEVRTFLHMDCGQKFEDVLMKQTIDEEEDLDPVTPSRVPLPLSKDTPYVASTEPEINEEEDFDHSIVSSDGPISPSPVDPRQDAYNTPTPRNKYVDLLAKEDLGSTPMNQGSSHSSFETPRNVSLPASVDTPYVALSEEEIQDVEMEDVEEIQEDVSHDMPTTPPTKPTYQLEMTSSETDATTTDENIPPAPVSPPRNDFNLMSLMPLTPKPRTGRNSLRRNLLLYSSQKIMEAELMQRARMMQSQSSARGAQLVVPTPIRLQHGTPCKTALPSPGMTDYASSESDEDEADGQAVFEDASDHFDEDEDYEDVSGAYETDAEELKAGEDGEEDDQDEGQESDEQEEIAMPQVSWDQHTP